MPIEINILLATHNGERFLEEQIRSLFAQTYPNWQLIIRDDASSDSTADVIERLAQQNPERIKSLGTNACKQGACMNFGFLLSQATAPYVMFCDQDDVWLPEKIQTTLVRMRRLEKTHGSDCPILVHTDLMIVDDNLRVLANSYWRYQNLAPRRTNINHLLVQNVPNGCAMMINRSLAEMSQPISRHAVMHDQWIALVASALGKIDYIDTPTMLYRQHHANHTGALSWGLSRVIREAQKGIAAYRHKFYLNVRQAQAFLAKFGDDLPPSIYKAINAMATMPQQNFLRKRLSILEHHLFKKGLMRNLAQLLVAH